MIRLVSNRTFDIYCDEESKMKNPFVKNDRATKAWYVGKMLQVELVLKVTLLQVMLLS